MFSLIIYFKKKKIIQTILHIHEHMTKNWVLISKKQEKYETKFQNTIALK